MLVCAPTGAGKTVVGEFAVHLALATGGKCFYTTPIKALSNQKFADLIAAVRARPGRPADRRHLDQLARPGGGDDHRGAAQHALRRLADLAGLTHVVMDEIHYLADKFRGPVWEEVILHLAADVQRSWVCPPPSPTPRSSAPGWPRSGASWPSSSTRSGRFRCGST